MSATAVGSGVMYLHIELVVGTHYPGSEQDR
jgi:hypothetical protein